MPAGEKDLRSSYKMWRGTITSLSVLIAFSFFVPSALVPFDLCSYNENYKSTFEERKFYATITKKTILKCSNVILKQIADIPSNPRGIFIAAFPKACFLYRVCLTLTIHG